MAYAVNDMLKDKLSLPKGDKAYLVYGDTDSVVGDTVISMKDDKQTIESLYNKTQGSIEVIGSDNYVKRPYDDIYALSMNENKIPEYKKVNYIMAHKVKKRMFKIKVDEDEVIVTEDHSLIVLREDKLVEVSAKDVVCTDKFIKILS